LSLPLNDGFADRFTGANAFIAWKNCANSK
jgi:hypothetical protein